MSRPSILTSRQKISRHKVSTSRHSALCHDSGVRHCVANKAGCARDRGALPRTTEELCRPRQNQACTTGMCVRLGCVHDRGASVTEVFCRDRLVQKKKKKKKKKKTPANLGRHKENEL